MTKEQQVIVLILTFVALGAVLYFVLNHLIVEKEYHKFYALPIIPLYYSLKGDPKFNKVETFTLLTIYGIFYLPLSPIWLLLWVMFKAIQHLNLEGFEEENRSEIYSEPKMVKLTSSPLNSSTLDKNVESSQTTISITPIENDTYEVDESLLKEDINVSIDNSNVENPISNTLEKSTISEDLVNIEYEQPNESFEVAVSVDDSNNEEKTTSIEEMKEETLILNDEDSSKEHTNVVVNEELIKEQSEITPPTNNVESNIPTSSSPSNGNVKKSTSSKKNNSNANSSSKNSGNKKSSGGKSNGGTKNNSCSKSSSNHNPNKKSSSTTTKKTANNFKSANNSSEK